MSRWIRRTVERMIGYVPGEQRSGPGVLKLNTNENPYPPSPRVTEAIRRFSVASLRLYPDPLSRELRETIARVHGVSSDQVFVGNGSDEILRLITLAFVEDDGAIARFHPSYTLYDVLAQCRGVPLRRVALGPDFGWRSPPPRLRASLFFLTSPNSPTGRLYPDDALDTGAFGDKEVDVVRFIHDGLQTTRLGLEIKGHLRHINGMNLPLPAGEAQVGKEGHIVQCPAIGGRRRGRQPPTIPPHDLVDDQHPGVGAVLGHHMGEETRTLFGGRPGAQRLPNGEDIVVHRLG